MISGVRLPAEYLDEQAFHSIKVVQATVTSQFQHYFSPLGNTLRKVGQKLTGDTDGSICLQIDHHPQRPRLRDQCAVLRARDNVMADSSAALDVGEIGADRQFFTKLCLLAIFDLVTTGDNGKAFTTHSTY